MSESRRVLAVAFARGIGELRSHLLQLGYLPLEVDDLDGAAHEFERGTPLAGPVLLSMNHAERGLRRGMDRLRAAAGARVGTVAVGPPPHAHTRRLLRNAGIAIGLWTPYALDNLRLVLELASPARAGERRSYRRVPTHLAARIACGDGEMAAVIRDLSVSGACFETPEPLAPGTDLVAHFTLDEEPMAIAARVAFCVAPPAEGGRGGFGARFLAPSSSALAALAGYVNARTDARRI